MYENLKTALSDRHLEVMTIAVNILTQEPYLDYVTAVYLFGSCARGQQKYHSDVDLLVQCENNISPEIMRSMSIAVMPESLDLPEVELKFVKGNAWKDRGDCFSNNLMMDGVLLWEKK